MPGMTSTPPSTLADTAPRAGESDPPSGGVGPSRLVYFLATCHRCEPLLSQPFTDADARDDWAAKHVAGTRHCVILSIDGVRTDADHLTVVLRPDDTGPGFKWLCTTCADAKSGRWNGPYPTPQLALASFCAHGAA